MTTSLHAPLPRPTVPPSGPRLAPFHEQILRVALAPPDRAVEEWERLRAGGGDLWDSSASQLLPLLSRALVGAGVDDPDLPRLQTRARSAWFDNQLLFRRLGAALEVLDAAGVTTLALKGVPLALRHYPDASLRPMLDFDLLVDPEAAPAAVAALRNAGWTVEWALDPDFVARTSEVPCRSPDGHGILDLHWRLVPWVGRSWSAADPASWKAAVPLTVGDQATLAQAPHDLLLHVILHAYRSGPAEVPRWVADVVVLLRSAGDALDWDRFVERVLGARLALPVAAALSYVSVTFEAPVPGSVLARLSGVRSTRREIHKHHIAQQPITKVRDRLFGEARDLRTSWARGSVNFSRTGALRSLGPFLHGRTHVDHVWALPLVVAGRRIHRARAATTARREPTTTDPHGAVP